MSEKKKLSNIKWIMSLPNYLTIFRLASVPVLLILYPIELEPLRFFCAFLFCIAALTDWLDGVLARRLSLESRLGAVLDPLADKMLTAAGLVLVVSSDAMYVWVAGLLLCREVAMTGLRLLAVEQGFIIKVSLLGKWKTLFLDIAITCLMVNQPLFGWPFREVGMAAMWLALFASLYSGGLYAQEFWQASNQTSEEAKDLSAGS